MLLNKQVRTRLGRWQEELAIRKREKRTMKRIWTTVEVDAILKPLELNPTISMAVKNSLLSEGRMEIGAVQEKKYMQDEKKNGET